MLARALPPQADTVHVEVDDGRGIERKHLAEDKTSDNRDSEWTSQFRADAVPQRKRHGTQMRSHGSHQDGAETKQARLEDRISRTSAFVAFRGQGEIDHENGIFLHDANE